MDAVEKDQAQIGEHKIERDKVDTDAVCRQYQGLSRVQVQVAQCSPFSVSIFALRDDMLFRYRDRDVGIFHGDEEN